MRFFRVPKSVGWVKRSGTHHFFADVKITGCKKTLRLIFALLINQIQTVLNSEKSKVENGK
ncbi:MAG: hypothetical protein DRI57_19780 [Deltaproteobacteria bacterium]|nr:MAG: hypothetical protein DRI57_19780 [Deltaproteobacteria bacterium]